MCAGRWCRKIECPPITTIQIGYGQNIQHGQNVSETEKKVYSTCTFSVQKKVFRGGGSEGHSAASHPDAARPARRRTICGVSSGRNIENRPRRCASTAATAVPNILTPFSKGGMRVFGRALQPKRPLFSPQRTLQAPTKPAQVPFPPMKFMAPLATRVLMHTYKAAFRKFFGRFCRAVHEKSFWSFHPPSSSLAPAPPAPQLAFARSKTRPVSFIMSPQLMFMFLVAQGGQVWNDLPFACACCVKMCCDCAAAVCVCSEFIYRLCQLG